MFQLAQTVLRKKTKVDVSYVFVGEAIIKKLNNQYRKKNKVTDVLSFSETDQVFCQPGFLGEIIVCPRQAERQSKEYKVSLEKEVIKLSVHGLLHLYGYDHEKEQDAAAMEGIETKILNKFYA